VAVIAHRGKTIGGGLDELRRLITGAGVEELDWYEVAKSRQAPKRVRRALRGHPDRLVVWGGDGMVQRCLDTVAGRSIPVAVIPAGTANLFARNLGLPLDLAAAVTVALHGAHRRLDLGRFNGEHFAVMAGLGFDAEMIDGAGGRLKRRLGRLAYLVTGARNLRAAPVEMSITVDGGPWFAGAATCVLFGNVPKVFGEVEVFDGAEPDDGWLDLGVTTASDPVQWAQALAEIGTGPADRSPHVRITRAKRVTVKLRQPLRHELDGGSRAKVRKAKVRVVPAAVTVCVPAEAIEATP
jgi:diacylglycerol kinase family enzyme